MYYTIADIKKLTCLSERTLRNYIKNGILSGEKVSGRWRFSAENVNAFFNNNDVISSMRIKAHNKYISFITGEEMKTHPESRLLIIGSFADYEDFSPIEGLDIILNSVAKNDFDYFRIVDGNRPISVFSGKAADLMEVLTKLTDYYKDKKKD